MATINFSKVSGVITVTQTSGAPKSYFGLTGTYSPNASSDGYNIQIGGTSFQVSLTDLRVNGQAPANLANGLTLLGALFGT